MDQENNFIFKQASALRDYEYELSLFSDGVLVSVELFIDFLTAESVGHDWVSENPDNNTFTINPDDYGS
jgi:hypothetical protein